MNKYLSHPDKLLFDHLLNVSENSYNLVQEKKLNIGEFISLDVLSDVSYIIGVCHDFGKFTTYFQNYIKETDEKKKLKLKNQPETHHGFISAILSYFIVQDYLRKRNLLTKKFYEFLPVISFLIVRRHHGDLNNALDDSVIEENDIDVWEKQLATIDFDDIQNIYDQLLSKINYLFDFNIFKNGIEELKGKTFDGKKKLRNIDDEKTLFYYFILLFLYSILLDSDKIDAAKLSIIKRLKIPIDLVDNYKQIKFSQNNKGVNKIRNSIYEEVITNVGYLDLEKDKILSLNAPTGSGKTLTSLSFALKLRERIHKEKKYLPKIIYSLPFLSIIDQNYEITKKILYIPSTNILLKHHHLSDIYYSTKEDEYTNTNNDIGKNLLQIEGWNSEIIFTTFIQFFYSTITNKNRAVRKFHNIANSIVILDEIQAIPHHYWLLLNQTISFFAKYFNTYFVLMTATQPLILDNARELVKEKTKYFNELNRFDFSANLESIEIKDFIEILKKALSQTPKKDFLIVLNTIKTSTKVFNTLKDFIKEGSQFYYLSTSIIPKERLRRIREMKEPNIRRKIIISTQVIEAGVDLDADIVYRDFAPLDSVNQVAGRCNRNFKKEKGKVFLFNLFDVENERKYFPKSIYDSFLISKTEDILENLSKVEEKDFLELTNKYFEKVKEGLSNDKAKDILSNVESLKFSELSEFKLIEKDYPQIDVFIELDEDAQKVWHEYENIHSDEKLTGLEKRNAFLKIRKEFNNYIISVPEKYAMPYFNKGILNYISQCEVQNNVFYDLETGFKRDNTNSGILDPLSDC